MKIRPKNNKEDRQNDVSKSDEGVWRCRVIWDVAFKTAEVSVSVKGGLFVPFAVLNSSA